MLPLKENIVAVKQHLAAGTYVNAKNDDSRTPLHRAAWEGRRGVSELLIAEGADVNATTYRGITPLVWPSVVNIPKL